MSRHLFLGGPSHGRWLDVAGDQRDVAISYLGGTYLIEDAHYRRAVFHAPELAGVPACEETVYLCGPMPPPRVVLALLWAGNRGIAC